MIQVCVHGGDRTWGVIWGVRSGTVYALRVMAVGGAGFGKKSPTVYFTLEGQILMNPETTDVMNGAVDFQITKAIYLMSVIFVFERLLYFTESIFYSNVYS